MNNWIKQPYRTETIVLHFKDQESFADFWDKYIKPDRPSELGVAWTHIAKGDKLDLLDKCQELLCEASELVDDSDLRKRMVELAES